MSRFFFTQWHFISDGKLSFKRLNIILLNRNKGKSDQIRSDKIGVGKNYHKITSK